jgi:hypothetical protein
MASSYIHDTAPSIRTNVAPLRISKPLNKQKSAEKRSNTHGHTIPNNGADKNLRNNQCTLRSGKPIFSNLHKASLVWSF